MYIIYNKMILFKFICFIIYSLSVTVFMHYVHISYIYNLYKDWLFCDFKNESNFDYIIVGAGSAGSILSKRLLSAGAKILLIEAGGPPISFFDIPILTPLLLNTAYDWQYLTVPQKNSSKGLNYNQSIWSSGKILGGSSRLNNMIYVQGHPNDYKSWFPDFKEPIVENGGFVHMGNQNWHSKLSDAILKAMVEISNSSRKINNISSTDFMKACLTIKDGERWSTDRVIQQHNRLKLLTNSLVTKILFKSKKAVGVKLLKSNKIYKAFASRGVIICAGAVGTPKLLMLSGVGPKAHLQEHNIKVKADLPVGQNLMDHIITGFDLVTLKSNIALSITDILNPYSIMEYYLFRRGPWTSSGVDVIGSFYSKLKKNASTPDLQIMIFPTGLSQDNGITLTKNLGISSKTFKEYFSPLTYKIAITIAPVLLHPKSKGEVKLKSSNPFDAPIIDPKYLSSEEDILTLIDGIQLIKKLIQTKAMREVGAQLYEKSFPGCENFVFDSIHYWRCYLKHLTLTAYHPGGTCMIGAVVDSKFRVYKMKHLFVTDASIFPELPSGNIHIPVIMLAEKAASLLIEDFKNYINWHKCYKSDIFLYINKCE